MKKDITITSVIVCLGLCILAWQSVIKVEKLLEKDREEEAVTEEQTEIEEISAEIVASSDRMIESEQTKIETEKHTETEDEEAPRLILKTERVVIKAGEDFTPLYYVESVSDNKADQDFLYYNIRIVGDYDTHNAGNYRLEYYVQDDDGNLSAAQELSLVVE